MSSKTITLKNVAEAEQYIQRLEVASMAAREALLQLAEKKFGTDFLGQIKFNQIGFDPLQPNKSLNLIEQVNQCFTYLASFKAAQFLFSNYKDLKELKLNLGTASGIDIESADCGGIVAEVFAATSPDSNQKLNKDIEKIKGMTALNKYVFFMCPGIQAGQYLKKANNDVMVWSLGCDIEEKPELHYFNEDATDKLFNEEPFQWGLRGDPVLWNKLRAFLLSKPMPRSEEGFGRLVEAGFSELTGGSVHDLERIYMGEYDQGGMSGGYISPEFWRVTGIPLLSERFSKILESKKGQ